MAVFPTIKRKAVIIEPSLFLIKHPIDGLKVLSGVFKFSQEFIQINGSVTRRVV